MKSLFAVLLAVLAAAVLTVIVNKDNGYVLIGYGAWTVESSLALFGVLNLLAYGVIYLAFRSLASLWAAPGCLRDWRNRRSNRRSRNFLTRGLVELAEGRWREAEKSLTKFSGYSDTPLLNYLAAARAAQSQGAHERRDTYLQQAHESMPSADVAVSLTQAELQLAHHQTEQALATLMHLRAVAPKHRYVLKLLKSLYEELGDWGRLAELMPELRSNKIFSDTELKELEVNIESHLMQQAADDSSPSKLGEFWESLSRSMKGNSRLIFEYAKLQIERNKGDRVEGLLHDNLNQRWDEKLIMLYGLIDGAEPTRMLGIAEKWLTERPQDPNLLLALGRIAMRGRLWGKARSYFEASIGERESAEAYRELGALLEQLDEPEQAGNYYRKGLELATQGCSPCPIPVPELLGSRSLRNVPSQPAKLAHFPT